MRLRSGLLGMSSMRATTTALVRDLDISYDDLTGAVETHLVAAGMGPAALGPVDFADLLAGRCRRP